MTTLNNTFETELAQDDECYESGSESFDIPTPLSIALRLYHVSTVEDLFSILQTLVNHQQPQNCMQNPHLADAEVAVSPTTNCYSPVQMMRVL